jgi:hypothetical protein
MVKYFDIYLHVPIKVIKMSCNLNRKEKDLKLMLFLHPYLTSIYFNIPTIPLKMPKNQVLYMSHGT